MKRPYYILSSGKLVRRQNTLVFFPFGEPSPVTEGIEEDALFLYPGDADPHTYDTKQKRTMPIDGIDSIWIFGEMSTTTKFFDFVSQRRIPVHFFNYYGHYTGSFYPREYLNSGFLLVRQVEHYRSRVKRLFLARSFVEGAAHTMLKNLRYYHNRGIDVGRQIEEIEKLQQLIAGCDNVDELRGIEGNVRIMYYDAFPRILRDALPFEGRSKKPPLNALNALISFCNSLVYTACLGEIYHTQLSPLIAYLHEPGERRFSLALDIAEIFKPLIADRLIFSMVNQKMIRLEHFDSTLEFCYLRDKGRRIVLKQFEEKMQSTFKHRGLNRHVSYRRLIRLECYKLVRHLIGDTVYKPFKAWW